MLFHQLSVAMSLCAIHLSQRRLAAALMGRLHQLPRQQLFRLPLLLARLGLTSLRQPDHLQVSAAWRLPDTSR